MWPRLRACGPLAVALLLAWDAASPPRGLWELLLAGVVLAAAARRTPRLLLILAGALLAAEAGARLHLHLQARAGTESALENIQQRLDALVRRKDDLIALLTESARHVSALPDAGAALAGDRAALDRLFLSLDQPRAATAERPGLAVLDPASAMVAWSGRIGEISLAGVHAASPEVIVVEGRVSTTLLAAVPVRRPDGSLAGWAVALVPVDVRRNIRNEFLHDFDLLAGTDPGIEVRYVDHRAGLEAVGPFPPLDPALLGREARLLGPDGDVLALARVAAPGAPEVQKALFARYQRLLALLATVLIAAWIAFATLPPWVRWALGAVALRAVLALVGPPVPGPDSPLLSPDLYASSLLSQLGPLLRSPLDLFLTALTLTVLLGALAARQAVAAAPRPFSPARSLLAWLSSLLALRAFFHLLADTVTNCSLDLATVTLVPRSLTHLLLEVALLLLAGCAALAVGACHVWAGAPRTPWAWSVWTGGWVLATAALLRPWPSPPLGLPAAAAASLLLVAAGAGATLGRWKEHLDALGPEAWAGAAVAASGALAAFLYPSLFHAVEQDTRHQIEEDYAAHVRQQPQRQRYVLEQAERRIDALRLLEETPPGARPPGIEELAFAVWSATDLAGFGFSSAIEVQDATGAVMSRFALNLPSLSSRPLPANESWRVTEEPLTLASAERRVRYARRLLFYGGEVKGAIHVYVADDFWNLSFLRGRDPYSVLYRTASLETAADRPVALVAYGPDGQIVFSSVERPPMAPPAPPAGAGGRWLPLALDGQPHHAYAFADHGSTYLLAYPRTPTGRYAADLMEAVAAFVLLALAALLLVLLLRTALHRPRLSLPSLRQAVAQRFTLRLFVVLSVLAFVPVAVLETVVRRFVTDRLRREAEEQALERASVARKAVEDFAFFQRGEGGRREPVTDAALVWVASVVRNDLDVFENGSLVASSKRELYDSGLLPRRVSGAVYRALLLDGQPASLGSERIGAFSYLVASVPLRLGGAEPAILSLPLASRQREMEATVEALDRIMRLASVVFFALAALLAHSLARRISDPIRQLTDATRRIALGDLSTRVSTTSQDELQRLVESFNQMAHDLDRQRRDLERSNRVEAWAEMARQVAHEVKNPLTPIQLSTEHLRRVWRDGGADFGAVLEGCTRTILRQVQTLRGIVTEFLAFARPPAPDLEGHDLARLLTGALEPYRSALPPGIEMTVEIPPGPVPVQADARLLERALVNLVENALQAAGEEGHITVRLRAAADRASIEIEDSGPGIDPEIRDRIFEPFFSTKTGGSGLGLALVKKIAQEHGGGVAVESPPGGGTRATLWLPVAWTEAAVAATVAAGRPEPDD